MGSVHYECICFSHPYIIKNAPLSIKTVFSYMYFLLWVIFAGQYIHFNLSYT
jgi:hypothetical protein